jgi:hypothetical protein
MWIARTAALVVTVAFVVAACQPDGAPRGGIYTVDGKPIPSVAASDPAYVAFPEFKAMAVNGDGTAFLSIGQCSAAKAMDAALSDCRDRSAGQACRVAAIGNADASGLDDSGLAQLIRQHSRYIAKLRQASSRSATAIPVVLAGEDVPYVTGFASGELYYDPGTPCVGAVGAQTKEGLICDGVWQFRRRLYSTEYPVEGDLDFECSNGAKIAGTYVTFASGFGAARVTDDHGQALFAIYGPDVAGGVNEGGEFLRLWQERAAHAPEASIFQQRPVIP